MDALIGTASTALLCALAGMAGHTVYRLWRAGTRDLRPMLMHRVLERKGLDVAGCADAGLIGEAGAAARRCLLCRESAACRAWLEGDAPDPIRRVCPNADLMIRLADSRRSGSPPGR